jgi:hypothetical protein
MANLSKLLNAEKVTIVDPLVQTAIDAIKAVIWAEGEQQFGFLTKEKDGSETLGVTVYSLSGFKAGGWQPSMVLWIGSMPKQAFIEKLESEGISWDEVNPKREKKANS